MSCQLYSTAQDVLHHFSGWTLSDSLTDIGPVTNEGEASCAEAAAASWEYLDTAAGQWRPDPSLALECADLASCCARVTVASTGAAAASFPELMGSYESSGQFEAGRPVYANSEDTQQQLR